MYHFNNDYSEVAAPEILAYILEHAHVPQVGYGLDPHSERAAERIRTLIRQEDAAVHFLVGGTQTNKTMIAAALKPFQAVICAESGHINVHEAGAIEGTGHKVLTAPASDGKLRPEDILRIKSAHTDEHMVQPALVYISQTTELGTVYRLSELKAIAQTCKALGLLLFIDGARIASALSSPAADFDLADIASHCDAFTIGGTKNGLLFGEAAILLNDAWKCDFRFHVKQMGAMLAKGFVSGMQFERLMEGDLYLHLAGQANRRAAEVAETIDALHLDWYAVPESNQLFPILPSKWAKKLAKSFLFMEEAKIGDDSVACRFVTSWASNQEATSALCLALRELAANERE